MMVAIKPGSPGRARRKPLKPFARGKPADPVEPVVDLLVCFFVLRTGPRVRLAHPAFPAPSAYGGKFPQNSGGQRREIANACFPRFERSHAGVVLHPMMQCTVAGIGIGITILQKVVRSNDAALASLGGSK
jgi:hypothetical protein